MSTDLDALGTDLDALEFALSELPEREQLIIRRSAKRLIKGMAERGARDRGGFGKLMALELLHSVGRYLNEHNSDFVVQ